MSDLGGLTEPVPNQVRILASQENLGTLRSAHRPSTWLSKIQFRKGRIFVFDQGVVLSRKDGARLQLFRVGQMRLKGTGSGVFVLAGPRGQAGFITGQWSGGEQLRTALSEWELTHPWQ